MILLPSLSKLLLLLLLSLLLKVAMCNRSNICVRRKRLWEGGTLSNWGGERSVSNYEEKF